MDFARIVALLLNMTGTQAPQEDDALTTALANIAKVVVVQHNPMCANPSWNYNWNNSTPRELSIHTFSPGCEDSASFTFESDGVVFRIEGA
jgi:hypothetical protein